MAYPDNGAYDRAIKAKIDYKKSRKEEFIIPFA